MRNRTVVLASPAGEVNITVEEDTVRGLLYVSLLGPHG